MNSHTQGAIIVVADDDSGESDLEKVHCGTGNLWQQAFHALSHENRQCLKFAQDESVAAPSPEKIIEIVNQKRDDCKGKQWELFTNKKGEKVLFREVMEKICDWAAKFQKIGDAAVEYVPHAAIPWAIIKALTQMTINDCQTFGHLLEAIERISSIIALYTELETRLLIRVSPLSEQLASSMLKLYTAVLQFLARTHSYYTQKTASKPMKSIPTRGIPNIPHVRKTRDYILMLSCPERMMKSVFTSSKEIVDEPMLQINSLEDDVQKRASFVSQECGNSMVESLLKLMQQNVMNSKTSTIAERRTRLAARINGINTQDTLDAALGLHHLETCEWVFQLDVFKDWIADDSVLPKLLWIHGPPGFGKTILSAWIIRHLQNSLIVPVSYFFCVAENERTRDPYAILRSWLVQILQNDAAVNVMETVISGRKGDGSLTSSELWELFVAVGQLYPGFVLLMDGFDECTNIGLAAGYHKDDSRNIFLRDLMHHLPEARARVLSVSRDVGDIREYLGENSIHDGGVHRLEYRITSEDTAEDVKAFSAHVVGGKLSKKKENLRSQIANEAAERSEGMFLWIQLLEKAISPGHNAKELKEIVREMPSGISQAYARELEKIDRLKGRSREQAIVILRWVLFALRPLQVKELAEALIVSDDESQSYPEDGLPDEWEECFVDEEYVKKILGFGGSLLRLRSESSDSPLASHTVHFVHFSVKEYLTSNGAENHWAAKLSLSDPSSETNALSRVCLRYLTMNIFDEIPTDTRLYPFLSYASWAWYFHSFYQKPPPGEDILDSTKRAFNPSSLSWKVWTPVLEQRLISPDHTNLEPLGGEDDISIGSRSESSSGSHTEYTNPEPLEDEEGLTRAEVHNDGNHLENPIYYASMLGLTDVVDWLAGQGLRVDCVGGRFGFPLQAASARGHTETVAHLLNRGAPVDQVGGEFHTALIGAATCATLGTVRRLLDANADVTLADEGGLTALDHAAKKGATDIVEALIAHGAKPSATARRLACSFGHRGTLRGLMVGESSFSPDQVLEDIRALDHAMRYAHFNVVIDVIDQLPAAIIPAPLKDGYTLLHHAAAHGALPVVQKLLHHSDPQRRAETNRADSDGWSALHEACTQGDNEVVLALLTANADVTQGDLYMTPLQAAASRGHCEIIKTLYEHGADINQKTRGSVTALRIAVRVRSMEAVKTLLDLGAGMSGTDEHSGVQHTLYETASQSGEYEIADLLLRKGCFGTAENPDVDRYLPVIVSRTTEAEAVKNVQSALSQHPRPSDSILGETLRVAALSGYANLVHLLLDLGAPVNARDLNGRTALHYAALHGHDQLCEELVKVGASIAIEDNDGSHPIDLAVCLGSQMISFINSHMADLMKQIRRRPSLLIIPPSDGLALKPASPLSVRQALTGLWEGEYEYLHWNESLKEPWTLRFPEIKVKTTNIYDNGNPKVLDEEALTFSTSGTDEWGDFGLNGFVDQLSYVWFVKLYESQGWLYKGKLSDDMKELRGTWGGNRRLWHGTFVLSIATGSVCK